MKSEVGYTKLGKINYQSQRSLLQMYWEDLKNISRINNCLNVD